MQALSPVLAGVTFGQVSVGGGMGGDAGAGTGAGAGAGSDDGAGAGYLTQALQSLNNNASGSGSANASQSGSPGTDASGSCSAGASASGSSGGSSCSCTCSCANGGSLFGSTDSNSSASANSTQSVAQRVDAARAQLTQNIQSGLNGLRNNAGLLLENQVTSLNNALNSGALNSTLDSIMADYSKKTLSFSKAISEIVARVRN